MLKILYIGDISGKPGRMAVKSLLSKLKKQYKPDLVIANGENAAGGRGVTREIISELISYGVDIVTGGDHTFSVKGFFETLGDDLPFVRPANFEAPGLPGKGFEIVDIPGKGRVVVIQLLGRELFTHIPKVKNPFWYIDELLEETEISSCDLKLVELHAEASSEKLAFGWYVRDRVDAVIGTHTHVATADNRLLGGRLPYVTDIGQVGVYDASLWADFENVIHNFKYPNRKPFVVAEEGARIFNSILITYKTMGNTTKNLSPQSIERVDVVIEE